METVRIASWTRTTALEWECGGTERGTWGTDEGKAGYLSGRAPGPCGKAAVLKWGTGGTGGCVPATRAGVGNVDSVFPLQVESDSRLSSGVGRS